MLHKYDLLIFDLDGTLVDSQHDLAASVNLLRRAHGKEPLSLLKIRSFVGNGIRALVERVLPDVYNGRPDDILKEFRSYYQGHLLDTTVPYPGIAGLLEHFKDRKLAVLTNKSEHFALSILQGLKIDGYFTAIQGSNSGLKPKPHPEAIHHIMDKVNAVPGETIMIGDGVNDILSAQAAKIACAAVGYGYTKKEDLLALKPDFYFDTVGDLQRSQI